MIRKRSAPRTGAATQPDLWTGATDEARRGGRAELSGAAGA